MTGRLFVYGTLRRDAGHPEHHRLSRVATFEATAWVRGRLYVVDWYPGLVLDPSANDVIGELWRLRPGADLTALDAYEGSEYARIVAAARPAEHETAVDAWVYAFLGRTTALQLVTSGDWLDTLPACP